MIPRVPAIDRDVLIRYYRESLTFLDFQDLAKSGTLESVLSLDDLQNSGAETVANGTGLSGGSGNKASERLVVLCAVPKKDQLYGKLTAKYFLMAIPAVLGQGNALVPSPKSVPILNPAHLGPHTREHQPLVMADASTAVAILSDRISRLVDNDREDPASVTTWRDWSTAAIKSLVEILGAERVVEAEARINALRAEAAVTNRTIRREQLPPFGLVAAVFAYKSGNRATDTIGQLYAAALSNNADTRRLRLMDTVAGPPAGTVLTGNQERMQNVAIVGAMDEFDSNEQLRMIYALDPTQRAAASAAMSLRDGELLAVNGPPGSGKTAMLRTVVASSWVSAAAEGGECPITIAAGATNQSIRNVIEAFTKVPQPADGPAFPLAERWLSGLDSYGAYLPAQSVLNDVSSARRELDNFMLIEQTSGSALYKYVDRFDVLDPASALDQERHYLAQATRVLGTPLTNVEIAVEQIRKRVRDCVQGIHAFQIDTTKSVLSPPIEDLLDARSGLWSERRIDLIRKNLRTLQAGRQTGESDDSLAAARESILDLTLRAEAFLWASHYWEGRFLLAQRTRLLTRHPKNVVEALRRLCMLTPCLVATLFTLPKLLKVDKRFFPPEDAIDFALGEVDLLIIDEAGQALPEIAAAGFLLAKRALVVGDVLQLEPIWNVSSLTETSIARMSDAHDALEDIIRTKRSIASGSALAMARLVSRYNGKNDDGMTLIFHYRCKPSIINYCNELSYNNRLQPRTKEDDGFTIPPMSWVEVDGNCVKSGGSWQNVREADEVTTWIVRQWPEWRTEPRFRDASIADIVAILTPYSEQATLIESKLKRKFRDAAGTQTEGWPNLAELSAVKIGTAHRLQGAERPIICFSLVEDKDRVSGSFADRSPALMNVAVSRAKSSFIIFANKTRLFQGNRQNAPPVHLLGAYMRKHGRRLYPRRLVVIEAPGKIKTLQAILGSESLVLATVGAITKIGLDKSVDVDAGFIPMYFPEAKAIEPLKAIVNAALDMDTIILATDDDRMGELIAWQVRRLLRRELGPKLPPVQRVRIGSLVPAAIRRSFADATELDERLAAAEAVRELLDALIVKRFSRSIKSFDRWSLVHDAVKLLSATNGIFIPTKDGDTKKIIEVGRVRAAVLRLIMELMNAKATQVDRRLVQVTAHLSASETIVGTLHDPTSGAWTFSEAEAKMLSECLAGSRLKPVGAPRNVTLPAPRPMSSTINVLAQGWRRNRLNPQDAMHALQGLYQGDWGTDVAKGYNNLAEPIEPEWAGNGHPPITPLDRTLTPERAAAVMKPSELVVYTIVWDYLTIAEGPPANVQRVDLECAMLTNDANLASFRVRFEGESHLCGDDVQTAQLWENLSVAGPSAQRSEDVARAWLRITHARIDATLKAFTYWDMTLDQLLFEMAEARLGRPSTYHKIVPDMAPKLIDITDVGGLVRLTRAGVAAAVALADLEPILSAPVFTANLEKRLSDIETGRADPAEVLLELLPIIAPEADADVVGARCWRTLDELELRLAEAEYQRSAPGERSLISNPNSITPSKTIP